MLIKNQNYKLPEIVLFAGEDYINTPEQIFTELIKNDYQHFYCMNDDYYGSKQWSKEVKFKANLKLYEIYVRKENWKRANRIGKILLETKNESNFTERELFRIERIINLHMERS